MITVPEARQESGEDIARKKVRIREKEEKTVPKSGESRSTEENSAKPKAKTGNVQNQDKS